MYSYYTVKNLIEDARIALKSEAYFSALALTFALVAECSNIEYPDSWFKENADKDEYLQRKFPDYYEDGKYKGPRTHDKERFIMWIDDQENAHNCEDAIKEQMEEYEKSILKCRQLNGILTPHIDGEFLYQLRCNLLHEASSDIDFRKKITDSGNKRIRPDMFTLVLDKYTSFGTYIVASSSTSSNFASFSISVTAIIDNLLRAVENYYDYKGNKEFKEIRVSDWRDSI